MPGSDSQRSPATCGGGGPSSGPFVDPVEAVPEAGEDLVADGAERGRQLVDAEVAADQGGEVAAAGAAVRNIGHVDGDQIHGDAAYEGTALAGHDDLRRALVAVGG